LLAAGGEQQRDDEQQERGSMVHGALATKDGEERRGRVSTLSDLCA
jgi:hypothetical protein